MRLKMLLATIAAVGAIAPAALAEDGPPVGGDQGRDCPHAQTHDFRATTGVANPCARKDRAERARSREACKRAQEQLKAEAEQLKAQLREEYTRIKSLPPQDRAAALQRLREQAEQLKDQLRADVEQAKQACKTATQ
jgi:acyl-CoA reductase-like NAD-dependent aldehyde dehydrogenase